AEDDSTKKVNLHTPLSDSEAECESGSCSSDDEQSELIDQYMKLLKVHKKNLKVIKVQEKSLKDLKSFLNEKTEKLDLLEKDIQVLKVSNESCTDSLAQKD
ncbi:hypothetical protein PSZ85_23545, partial [Shigella sonnei]|nr:hypothetical protein [Shigella sonnei]